MLDNQSPLADRMRPTTLDEFVGQDQLVGTGSVLSNLFKKGTIPSFVLWGPPGTGKTTIARMCASMLDADFIQLSAVLSGVKDIREAVEKAKDSLSMLTQKRTILFIDEIHRFSKSQQDSLLPHVESGIFTLIGATTENPSFEINSALLSRLRVFTLKSLAQDDIVVILNRALKDTERGLGTKQISISRKNIEYIAQIANGDARAALNILETAMFILGSNSQDSRNHEKIIKPASLAGRRDQNDEGDVGDENYAGNEKEGVIPKVIEESRGNKHTYGDLSASVEMTQSQFPSKTDKKDGKRVITNEIIAQAAEKSQLMYDKTGEEHYNTISAFIKSMRASDTDAALYYLARMVEAGEDPLFIARRMIVFASEDIGMGQPTALVVANEVFRACEVIGYPECAINLAHGVVYLATAQKDRRAYDALRSAQADIKSLGNLPIPLHVRNAPTELMNELGYGKGYEMYPKKGVSNLPEKLKGKKYF